MIEKASVILHWNTDYAEFPRSEFPKVVELSYEPMITAIEDGFIGTICFNITGHTFEYLTANYPELIDRIKRLAKANVVEMLATGYSHPILPLLPRERVAIQLKDHITLLKKIFGKKPKGIWPPELAVSPSVLSQFKKEGIEWTAVDYEHYQLSQFFGNDVNPFEIREQTLTEFLAEVYWTKGIIRLKNYLKAKKLFEKANLEHTEPLRRVTINNKETIKAYLSSVSWSNTT
ncbi:MAG: polysaccharide deacetylase family protein, partial [Candidatus Heimdallarchaeota archaeon]|nr:polysaccharide deacetylase family protein [Candidatus Heimdallarchaeota archaeon]